VDQAAPQKFSTEKIPGASGRSQRDRVRREAEAAHDHGHTDTAGSDHRRTIQPRRCNSDQAHKRSQRRPSHRQASLSGKPGHSAHTADSAPSRVLPGGSRTAAEYSNLPYIRLPSSAISVHVRTYFSNLNSNAPIATDQEVGGSSPSERARYLQVRGHSLGRERWPRRLSGARSLTTSQSS
jgi:hypothetical protein